MLRICWYLIELFIAVNSRLHPLLTLRCRHTLIRTDDPEPLLNLGKRRAILWLYMLTSTLDSLPICLSSSCLWCHDPMTKCARKELSNYSARAKFQMIYISARNSLEGSLKTGAVARLQNRLKSWYYTRYLCTLPNHQLNYTCIRSNNMFLIGELKVRYFMEALVTKLLLPLLLLVLPALIFLKLRCILPSKDLTRASSA